MAVRDYAKRSPSSPPTGFGGLRAGVVVLALLLVVAAGFVGGFFLGRDYGHQELTQQEREQMLAELQAQQRELEQLRRQQHERVDESGAGFGELTFYTELPSQSVTPAPLAEAPPKPAPSRPKKVEPEAAKAKSAQPVRKPAGGRFRVQVASYRGEAEAEALRLRLAKMGIPAWVEAAEVAGRGRWHRVYAGPYASRSQAEKVRLRIKRALNTSGLLRQE